MGLNPRDTTTRDHWLCATYAAGDTASAFKSAKEAVARHPTDLVPRAILALQGRREMDAFVREVHDFVGEGDFHILEASLAFADAGLREEAARIVSAACVDAVPAGERSPLPMYYLAWLQKGTPTAGPG